MAEEELEKIVARHLMRCLELKENREVSVIGDLVC